MQWLKKNWSPLVALLSAVLAAVSWWEVHKENLRAEKLFGSQVRPLIQSRPGPIHYDPTSKMARTDLVVIN